MGPGYTRLYPPADWEDVVEEREVELSFWGVRGSYPIARPDNLRYGGNSSCIHLRTPAGTGWDEWIIDGGSGIRLLGHSLMSREFGRGQGFARILISHTHWDHILGFPFFEPFYVAGNRFEVYSASQEGKMIEEILAGQQHENHFPVALSAFSARIRFHTLQPDERLRLEGAEVRTVQLNHPGTTLGFRIETRAPTPAAVTIYMDTARIEAVRLGSGMDQGKGCASRYWQRLVEHAAGSDLLVHDAHFSEEEIPGKEHWGHSTPADALRLAREAGVKRLALFHHAPEHGDDAVDRLVQEARDLANGQVEVFAAAEGQRVLLGRGDP